jgi:ABC-type glycerol-3-phosphate transport system substrate-binding protein
MISTSKNKDAAWQVIKWLVAGNGAKHAAEDAGQPMGFKAITPKPTGTDFDKYLGQPLYDALINGNNKFRRVLCSAVYNSLTKVIPGVVTGQLSSQDAAQEVQDAFDRGCQQWVQK